MNGLELADAVATEALGAALARTLPLRGVVFLQGNLGAGKSTLARGLLRALGVQGSIKSPTYTLIEPYTVGTGAVLHMDLYRLVSPLELANLGLEDYSPQETLWLVEWPEKGGDQLPVADLVIELQPTAAGRSVRFSGPLAQRLHAALQNQHE